MNKFVKIDEMSKFHDRLKTYTKETENLHSFRSTKETEQHNK